MDTKLRLRMARQLRSADCQSAVSADWQSAGHSNTGRLADCQSATQQTGSLRYFGGSAVAGIFFLPDPA
jgi:hypothetical protein